MPAPTGIYHGRLVTDGEGNLLADEGDYAGFPVAFHDGSYVFLGPGEASHNARHHQQFAEMTGTVDASMTDDPDLVNADDVTNRHHFGVLEDDPHYDPDPNSRTGTKPSLEPDAISAIASGHTDGYTGGGTTP
jgi:hypothetical protein